MGKHADKIAALRADEEGKPIQNKSLTPTCDVWSNGRPFWDFSGFEYREKPFEPEVDKVYVFSQVENISVAFLTFSRMDGNRYRTKNAMSWTCCRPLTEDEIGK